MKLKIVTPNVVKNKTVIMRMDYNVPLEKNKGGKLVVADDKRIKVSLDTINLLLQANAKVILMSHVGRPKAQQNPELSMAPIAKHLASFVSTPVHFVDDCIGTKVEQAVAMLPAGEILVLENLRFYAEEKKDDPKFARALAKLADVYVDEGFPAAHRKHASYVGITKYLPSFAGLAFAKEVDALSSLMLKPKRPFVMVIGGAKISDKVDAVEHLAQIADVVLVGGGVANNFLKADGFDVAKSYLQDTPADLKKQGVDYVKVAEELIAGTKQERLLKDGYIPLPKIIYPIDVIAAKSLESKSGKTIELTNNNGNGHREKYKDLMYLDIGEKTVRLFKELILQARTVFWNGPMGVFENPAFAEGTKEIARAIAKSSATTILGGGDTIGAIEKFGLGDRYDYVSAAGGAALEFLSGKTLVAMKPLLK